MAITHEDIQEIKRVLDDRYVLQADCDATQKNINTKLANDDKRIDLILLKQEEGNKDIKKNNWLTTATLGVIISIVIAMILKSIGVV